MDLSEISQYPHKIYKIDITNNNKTEESFYDKVTIKITLEKGPKEIIRFSKQRNSEWIDHKSSGDDYFLLIDNIEGVTVIYAHFFMVDLYEYEEPDIDVLYKYSLEELYNDIQANNIDVHYSSYKYDTILTEDKKIRIQSRLDNSIDSKNDPRYDNHKNPNYKNYNNIVEDNNIKAINQTEKGYFPIVSRYRNQERRKDNLSAPNVNKISSSSWQSIDDTFPYWEVHIKKDKFGSIVQNDTDDNVFPLNVHLNYHYLDTSTEYHQHFYGFEGKEYTECKDFNVFDSKDIGVVNNAFGDSHDYRIINHGNKTDARYNIDYSHIDVIDIDLENSEPHKCDWEKNLCHNYWTYTSQENNNYVDLPIELEKNKEYTLKYYIWIPYEVTKSDDCYIDVRYTYNDKEEIFESISDIFKEQDDVLRHDWIYHEFSFVTKTEINTIHIKGPQNPNNTIYFMDISLEKQKEYAPTLKYTQNDLFLSEGNQTTNKPNKEYKNCENSSVPQNTSSWTPHKVFPIPYNNVRIQVGDETDIIYDPNTATLSWYNGINSQFHIEDFNTYISNNLEWYNDREHGDYMEYGDDTVLRLYRNVENPLTYGINNHIDLTFTDNDNNPIAIGEVSCAISLNAKDTNPITDITQEYKYLGTKKVNHVVTFDKLDFRKFDKTKTYYLRIDYKHPCYERIIREYRLLYFEEEDISMRIDVIPEEGGQQTVSTNIKDVVTTGTYTVHVKEEFPLRVNTYLYTQVNSRGELGYCEMSINDKIFSTAFVDDMGYADFYLNYKDIEDNDIIKIEFFDNEEVVKKYGYFKIKVESEYDKPVVPIKIIIAENDRLNQKNNTFTIPKYGCLLFDVDTEEENDFSIQIYKDNKRIYFENIVDKKSRSIVIGDTDDDETLLINKTHTYKIITDNIKKQTANPLTDTLVNADDTYRPYQKTITINYIHEVQQ